MYVHECGIAHDRPERTLRGDESLASAAAGASVPQILKGDVRGGDGEGATWRTSWNPPSGRRRAPGLLRARLPRVLARRQPRSFCYPGAVGDVQNPRTFSFCLAPCVCGAGPAEGPGGSGGSRGAGSPGAVPAQASDSQTGRRSPAPAGASSPSARLRLGPRAFRNPPARERRRARVYRLAPLGRRNPRCTPFLVERVGGVEGRGGCRRG